MSGIDVKEFSIKRQAIFPAFFNAKSMATAPPVAMM